MRLITISLITVSLLGCGEAPADNSPVAPEAVCEEPSQNDSDSALECSLPEEELSD